MFDDMYDDYHDYQCEHPSTPITRWDYSSSDDDNYPDYDVLVNPMLLNGDVRQIIFAASQYVAKHGPTLFKITNFERSYTNSLTLSLDDTNEIIAEEEVYYPVCADRDVLDCVFECLNNLKYSAAKEDDSIRFIAWIEIIGDGQLRIEQIATNIPN